MENQLMLANMECEGCNKVHWDWGSWYICE